MNVYVGLGVQNNPEKKNEIRKTKIELRYVLLTFIYAAIQRNRIATERGRTRK